ncbi:MAG: penicillin-binding transpeptidase domain-containing protein [Hyphomicrobiaceae bacterium]
MQHRGWRRLTSWLVAMLATASAAYAVHSLGGYYGKNKEWVASIALRNNTLGAPQLFEDLMVEGAATFDLATLQIRLPAVDCADRLRVAQSDPQCPGQPDKLRSLILRLHQTAAGKTVQTQVEHWNTAFNVVAIRDNRFRGRKCSEARSAVDDRDSVFIVPKGCHPSDWHGMLALAGRSEVDISHRSAPDPSGQLFGFLASERLGGFGDWLSLDLARLPQTSAVRLESKNVRINSAQIRFSEPRPRARGKKAERQGRVPVGAVRPMAIDVIGNPTALIVDGRRIDLTKLADRRTVSAGPVQIRRERLCLDAGRRDVPRCTAGLLAGKSPFATRIVVSAAGGRQVTIASLAVEAGPVQSFDSKVRTAMPGRFCGVKTAAASGAAASDDDREDKPAFKGACPDIEDTHRTALTRRFGDNVELTCLGRIADGGESKLGADARCFLAWQERERFTRLADPSFAIMAKDQLLAETRTPPVQAGADAAKARRTVAIAPAASELGLVPVVGAGSGDFLSLAGQLVTRTRDKEHLKVELTIDPQMQRVVDTALTQVMTRTGEFKAISSKLPLGMSSRRRGAVVIIDADASPGDILAVATWPKPSKDNVLNEWDLRAIDTWNPAGSPLATLAWSQNDFLTVPGSTFKVLTALAGLQAGIDGNAAAARVIRGVGSDRELQSVMGISLSATAYIADQRNKGTSIGNAGKGNVGSAFLLPATTGCPRAGSGIGAQIGVCEATAKSINVWFARLAALIDQQKLAQVPRGQRASDIAMVKKLNHLYPDKRFSLAEESGIRLAVGSRLHATPIKMDAVVAPALQLNRPHVLALNGIGQSVQAPPTAIASIYASIATGRVVRPRVVRPAEGSATEQAPPILTGVGESQQTELLKPLRQGLKAVTSFSGGTADNAFAPYGDLHRYVFGKTGTGTVNDNDDRRGDRKDGYTVWFAGYLDPKGDQGFWLKGKGANSPIKRRIAFACMVTHADGFGGTVCAPLIARILDQLARAGAVKS